LLGWRMDITELDLKGYGKFEKDAKATFTLETQNLPQSWEYIYQNRKLLLRVDQFGPVYAQVDPPSGIVLFRRDQFQRTSSWVVWLGSQAFGGGAFTNFFQPRLSGSHPDDRPDGLKITFTPTAAVYTIENEGVRCVTEISVPSDLPAVCMKVSITNLRDKPLDVSAVPALRPYVNPALLAPWDKPEWYLRTGFCKDERTGFFTRLFSIHGDAAERRAVALWSDGENLSGAETSYEKFVGAGTFENPAAVWNGCLRMTPDDARKWGVFDEENMTCGFPPVHALQYEMHLESGETKSLRQVLAFLPPNDKGELPPLPVALKAAEYLDDNFCRADQDKLKKSFEQLVSIRSIETSDAAFDRYVNEWIPLELDWVCSLDRGWPSGMRGTRDSANDFTGMVALDPSWSRDIIRTLLSCQREDGWFLRQYSALGREGKHDERGYVDGGNWVIELLYEYLCYTKNLDFLDEKEPWLKTNEESAILEHALKALEYYLVEENIGEHGLCKIRGGDWLDTLSIAGREGRGESVTVTNQTIISLVQMSEIVKALKSSGSLDAGKADGLLELYAGKITGFKENLRAHAFNKAGYFNSVFTDGGEWVFSDNDPDGQRRVYGPANWWSISSGAAMPDLADSALKELEFLKCPQGYLLYHPPMGKKPISYVGRTASGDMPFGFLENSTAYNQGAHGFLARALGVAGKGDLLYEVLQYLLPYDQAKHPVEATMTPPYAIVNTWHRVPGFRGRGGFPFLTGTVACGARAVYSWMFGIQPRLDGLAINPCVPSSFKKMRATFLYAGKAVALEIHNPEGVQTGVKQMTLNGNPIERTVRDPFSGRDMFLVGDDLFSDGANTLVVTLRQ